MDSQTKTRKQDWTMLYVFPSLTDNERNNPHQLYFITSTIEWVRLSPALGKVNTLLFIFYTKNLHFIPV